MKTQPTTGSTPAHAAPKGPISDRWAFKPVALLLLFGVIVASSGLVAILLSPPFLAAGTAVREMQGRLDAAGEDFTRIPRLPQRSTIYANDGRTVLAHVYLDNREIVPLRRISPIAVKAVLAIEDSSFYEHGAIDIISTIRAAIENVKAGEVVQGGSTITQQLVKNTLGLDPNDRSLDRKLQELALAQRVEQHYSKDKILELYLNDVFLGNNVYGIGTAARFYFHKSAANLTLAEGALLAGLIQSPSHDDPIDHPHNAYLRRNDVLNRMIDDGPADGGVSARRGEEAKASDIVLAPNIGQTGLPTPPYLVNYVRQQLRADPNGWYAPALGDTSHDRRIEIERGGLDIITTLDPDWQKAAQRAANKPWDRTPLHPSYSPEPDVGLVSLDTNTGAIRTMLSGRDYQRDKINTVTTAHQPGSSFKPYLLAAAFEKGIPPTAIYSGVQGQIDGCLDKDSVWEVTNAEGTSLGSMDLYHATADSVNAVFARLIVDVGPANVVDMAHRVGITTELPAVCALATGSVGITPLDQASGYATFANSGIHCKPFAVGEIRRGRRVLYQQQPDCERVVSAPVANLVNKLLEGPVTYGTAASALAGWTGPPIRGKTGTADSNQELWFAGYTRQVTTAVWVGSPGATYPMPNYWGYSVFGGSIAAPIWRDFMEQVVKGMPHRQFPPPKMARVPSVVGMTKEAAVKALKDAGFKAEIEIVDSYLPENSVIEQNPPGGEQTIPSITVRLQVSNGNAPSVTLPSVKGKSLVTAQAMLSALHLSVTVVDSTTKDASLDGIVYGMSPNEGQTVLEGSSVTVFVWRATSSPNPSSGGGNGNGNGNPGNGGNGNGNGTGNGNGNGTGNGFSTSNAALAAIYPRRSLTFI